MDHFRFETPDMVAGNIDKIRHFPFTSEMLQQ